MRRVKSVPDYIEQLKKLKKKIWTDGSPFPDDTPELQAERIAKAKCDYYYFAKTYFRHYFKNEFADFHHEEIDRAIKAIADKDELIMAEYWFRGAGKTVNFGVALPIWVHIALRVMFFVYVGKDAKIITQRTIAVRAELTYNKALLHDFPELAMQDISGQPLPDGAESDFETNTGAKWLGLGYKQQLQGQIHGEHRPRYILIDDFESAKDKNPDIGKDKFDYVQGEAMGAGGDEGTLIVWLGNLTHSQSAANLMKQRCDNEPDNPHISVRLVLGVDEYGNPTWPARFTKEGMAKKRLAMGEIQYKRHILMNPCIEGKVFLEDWLQFYNPYAIAFIKDMQINNRMTAKMKENIVNIDAMPTIDDLRHGQIISYCDPSLGKKETNDFKGITTISFWGGRYWILDRHVRHESINDMLRYMYALDKRYKTKMFMETNFWQILIMEFVPNIAMEMGYVLPIKGIDNYLSKEERILTLQPLYQYGYIIDCTTGEDTKRHNEQLIGFPNANNDDSPDSESGAIMRYKEINAGINYTRLASQETSSFGQMF